MRLPPSVCRISGLIAIVLVLAVVAAANPAAAAPAAPSVNGTVKVVVSTPDGVPATVPVVGKTRLVAAKPPTGSSATVMLTAPPGRYHVPPSSMIFDGVRYVGLASTPAVTVPARRTVTVQVTFRADGGARNLHTTALSSTSVSLTWTAPSASGFILRRTTGSTPVTQMTLGTRVPTKGTSAVDTGLQPGTQYTYSLFTINRYGLSGPFAIVVNTASAADGTQATYVAASSTLLAKSADIASVTPTGSGVRVTLQAQVPPPVPGAAVVLPVSSALAGGYLGVVTSVSADGRTIELRAGSLIDAFDYYELTVPDFSVSVPGAPALKKAAAQGEPRGQQKAAGLAAAGASCEGSDGTPTISFSPSLGFSGHFSTKVDKYKFLGADIPTGASVDLGLTATVTGAASIDADVSLTCTLTLPKLAKTLAVGPVPLAITFEPKAQVSIGGGLKLDNIGLAASAGFQVNGSMTVKNGASFSGKTTANVTPLVPQISLNGGVGLKVGGDLTVGPGVGTSNAGVVAGLSGALNPVDASFSPYFPAGDSRFNVCVKAEAAASFGLNLTVKAWLSKWSFSETVALENLNGKVSYPGSPWDLPAGCRDLPGDQSKDSLLGPGVTKVSDSTVGGVDQWGHVDGFVPGKKSWVLSTGRMADALGSPGDLASTDLGREGDPELSALAGFPTYDAAAYTVTLTPTGSTLHVRYVFASEEYPEFVGSSFNDVMVVRVNGKNCATVPDTDTPVAVNTINHQTNTGFYVDNTSGAAGYSTSMDGLTVPLTCSVPVTPGQPVTVQIAVADTSDHVLDSAVALVDGGIWTD